MSFYRLTIIRRGELKALYIYKRGAKALGSNRTKSDRFTPLYTSSTKNVVF